MTSQGPFTNVGGRQDGHPERWAARIRWINGLLLVEHLEIAQPTNLSIFSHATLATGVHYQGRCTTIQAGWLLGKMCQLNVGNSCGFGFQVVAVLKFFSWSSKSWWIVAAWSTPMLAVAFFLSIFLFFFLALMCVCGVLFQISINSAKLLLRFSKKQITCSKGSLNAWNYVPVSIAAMLIKK